MRNNNFKTFAHLLLPHPPFIIIQGTFDTRKEAAKAFDVAAIQAGRPSSKLNFPPDQEMSTCITKKKINSHEHATFGRQVVDQKKKKKKNKVDQKIKTVNYVCRYCDLTFRYAKNYAAHKCW